MQNSTPAFPDEYHQILLALSPDGTPLIATLGSEGEVQAERLKYYNFLKWCRRPANAQASAHLAGRYNQVTISCRGNQMIFRLKTPQAQVARSALALAVQPLVADLPPVPPSANAHAYAPVPRGETRPLMPDLTPTPQVLFAPPKDEWYQQNLNSMLRNAEMVAAEPQEEVTLEGEWFPSSLKQPLTTAPRDQWGPQRRLQDIMNRLVFEFQDQYILPYPPRSDDPSETSAVNNGKVFKAWNEFLLNEGYMFYLKMEATDIGWRFSLTDEARKLLKENGIPATRIQYQVTIPEQNLIRDEIKSLFQQYGAQP